MTAIKRICAAAGVIAVLIAAVSALLLWQRDTDEPLPRSFADDEYTIENSIGSLAGFEDSRWDALTLEERLELVRLVKNIEICYLGIPHDISVELGDTDGILAKYNDGSRRMTLDTDFLARESGREVLRTVCHEVYHAYQYRLCEAYDSVDERYRDLLAFANVKDYRFEIEHYVDAVQDERAYSEQKIEENADSYAEKAVGDYFRKINLFLHNAEGSAE